MFCQNCGSSVPDQARFCTTCGQAVVVTPERSAPTRPVASTPMRGGSVGFSPRIHDPAFAKYLKNSNRYAVFFSLGLAVIAFIGFTIYGAVSSEMDNPQAMYIGLGIGAMFVVIALFQVAGRKKGRTWDGVVIDKTVLAKQRRRNTSGDDYYWEKYTEYTVIIRSDSGQKHVITVDDDDTLFNYYRVGDRVRHHAGLNTYEKFDKSNDSIVFCAACASLNAIEDEFCFRCHCPLLK